jgi:hypothetical protein
VIASCQPRYRDLQAKCAPLSFYGQKLLPLWVRQVHVGVSLLLKVTPPGSAMLVLKNDFFSQKLF